MRSVLYFGHFKYKKIIYIISDIYIMNPSSFTVEIWNIMQDDRFLQFLFFFFFFNINISWEQTHTYIFNM